MRLKSITAASLWGKTHPITVNATTIVATSHALDLTIDQAKNLRYQLKIAIREAESQT